MKLIFSDYFKKRLKKRLNKNPKLKIKVSKQLKLLRNDISYPSLKAHKLKGARASEYSIWIEGDLRIIFLITENGFLLTDIITHKEY